MVMFAARVVELDAGGVQLEALVVGAAPATIALEAATRPARLVHPRLTISEAILDGAPCDRQLGIDQPATGDLTRPTVDQVPFEGPICT